MLRGAASLIVVAFLHQGNIPGILTVILRAARKRRTKALLPEPVEYPLLVQTMRRRGSETDRRVSNGWN